MSIAKSNAGIAAWNGLPQNPESDGWHWLVPLAGEDYAWPVLWAAGHGWQWQHSTVEELEPGERAEAINNGSWRYGGSIPRPSQISAIADTAGGMMMDEMVKVLRETTRCLERCVRSGMAPPTNGASSSAAIVARAVLNRIDGKDA